MSEADSVVVNFKVDLPVMTYKKFAEHLGVSVAWVKEQVAEGRIPIMPKQGKEKPLINLVKYWEIAARQKY